MRNNSKVEPHPRGLQEGPMTLPVPLPNPTFIRVVPKQPVLVEDTEVFACKAEAATTKGLEEILGQLQEPLSVTHTASQEEVRAHLERWRPAIEKELGSLKKQGVLVSHHGKEAQELVANPGTSVISLKGVFTAKAPGGPEDGLCKRKCRLVGCGNQATHVDADSLYAAGGTSRSCEGSAHRSLCAPVVCLHHRHQVGIYPDANTTACCTTLLAASSEMAGGFRVGLTGGVLLPGNGSLRFQGSTCMVVGPPRCQAEWSQVSGMPFGASKIRRFCLENHA